MSKQQTEYAFYKYIEAPGWKITVECPVISDAENERRMRQLKRAVADVLRCAEANLQQ